MSNATSDSINVKRGKAVAKSDALKREFSVAISRLLVGAFLEEQILASTQVIGKEAKTERAGVIK